MQTKRILTITFSNQRVLVIFQQLMLALQAEPSKKKCTRRINPKNFSGAK
jgi:hypothetical protein